MRRLNQALFLLALSLFFFVASPNLFTKTMFMDGAIYATVSKNMSEGIGSFWTPSYTQSVLQDFYEHPPLALGLESLFFSVFGNHLLVERFYSVLILLLLAYVIMLIWREITIDTDRQMGWLPLFFVLPLPLIAWSVSNNMLENTLAVCTSITVLFLIRSLEKNRYFNILLASLFIVAGFLTKGPFALFPWSFFLWILICFKDYKLKRFILDSGLFVLFTLGLFGLLFLIVPDSLNNLTNYYEEQVVESLEKSVTVNSRFHIIERLVMEFLLSITLALVLMIFVRPLQKSVRRLKWTQVFLLLGFSASVPIMLSLKQRGFYIVPAIPMLALALAIYVLPHARGLMNRITGKRRLKRIVIMTGYFLLTASIALNLSNIGELGRDRQKFKDADTLMELVPERSIISAQRPLSRDFNLMSYLYRYAYISLDRDTIMQREYLLLEAEENVSDYGDYEEIESSMRTYKLYKRK